MSDTNPRSLVAIGGPHDGKCVAVSPGAQSVEILRPVRIPLPWSRDGEILPGPTLDIQTDRYEVQRFRGLNGGFEVLVPAGQSPDYTLGRMVARSARKEEG